MVRDPKKPRVALVTGGTRGIGAETAKAMKNAGYEVCVVDVIYEQIKAFEEETGIRGFPMDVADYASVEVGIKEIEDKVGNVDILVNNAGITRDGFMHKMKPKDWRRVIDVNLGGVFNTCRCVTAGMRKRHWGRIINISSMNALRGQLGQSNYAAAKAGMLGFTRSIAQELAKQNITVNAICPGFIMTEMTSAMPEEVLEEEVAKIPVGHIGEPHDISAMVVYLASEKARFITGATMSVNGGQYMAA